MKKLTTITENSGVTLLSIALVVSILLIVHSASGVRGTDQYWYLADVEQLASNQPPITNLVYPGKILRDNDGVSPNYFMHNGPMLHFAALLSRVTSPYAAWISINLACHLLVALCIFAVTNVYTSKEFPYLLTSLYLLSPIAIWQTLNLLQEQFYAGILALCFMGYTYRKYTTAHCTLVAALTIGIASHPLFGVLAFCYLIYFFITSFISKKPNKFLASILLTALFTSASLITPVLFPSSFQSDLSAIITSSIPGKTNMMWHYSNANIPVSADLLLDKLLYVLKNQLFSLRNSPLYLYTNIASLACLYLVIYRRRNYSTILIPCCLALAAYAAIVVLMQLQPRYQQIVAPASFITIGLLAHSLGHRVPRHFYRLGTVALLIATTAVSVILAREARQQGVSEKIALDTLRNKLSSIPDDANVVIVDTKHELKLSYALRPRKVMAVRTEFLNAESTEFALSVFEPEFLISSKEVGQFLPTISKKQLKVAGLGVFHQYKLIKK
ncbi:hypothetical protein AB833_25970 [Chromatiales bacterium (ex Bugula neritina AB1)]|nr:hypothetical protein AB833_25970 [Chromatiales bacterium (ex Bugula neritina AB1)]